MSDVTSPAAPAAPKPKPRGSQGWIRWKALVPLVLVLALVAGATLLYLDRWVERAVEYTGTEIMGARVDLASASVRLRDGTIVLRKLEATDAARPMTNLFEVEEIVLALERVPLLERKVVIDTMAVRNVRFGTPRTVSGALPESERGTGTSGPGAVRRAVEAWRAQVQVPPISLATLQQSVNVDAISAESLATLRAARHARAYADTARDALVEDLRALDPRPTLDSAQALAARLRTANLRSLGLSGVRQAVADVRRTLDSLNRLDDKLRTFQEEVRGNARGLAARLEAIPAARTEDYAYARSLLRLPTFEVPAIGPQLFSPILAERVGEVLYWANLAEEYLPPGVRRQLQPGPQRVRASGLDVTFPRERTWPDFLTRLAELSLAVGGNDAATGDYEARIVGLTNQPAVFGQPTRFLVERRAGRVGPRDIRIYGALDHRAAPVRDTLIARLGGISLPTLPLPGLGASVALGSGRSELDLVRTGDSLAGRWLWRAPGVRWVRDTSAAPRAASPAARLVEEAVWRAVSRIDSVEIEARFEGPVAKPSLRIRTNLAEAVANALRAQLGDEIRRAEQQVRARVDSLVAQVTTEARARAAEVRADLDARVAAERERLAAHRTELEARLRDLVRIPGIG